MIIVILKTVLILSGISGLLAILLVIADYFFANYGECKITINNKKEIKVEGGDSLLNTLNEQKIYLPSACGGRGSCGFCKCKVIDGGGPVLPTEKPFLSKEELNSNVRLSCQVKVKNDISINIPNDIFNIKKFKSRVSKIKNLTHDIKELTFDLLEPVTIDFKSGQYVQLQSKRYGKLKQTVSRAYSVSSNSSKQNMIQLIIRQVPDGICTTWVHQHLQEGDEVEITGPYGDFFLRDTNADIVFVAGGSGMAPIKSMIEDMNLNKNIRKSVFFFGARTEKDLYHTDYLKEFENKLSDFEYVPVLSRLDDDSDWKGKRGHIPPLFSQYINNPENTEAYLCGSPGMISAVVKSLINLGLKEDNIFYDKF